MLGDAFRAVGEKAFDYAGRREQRARLLQALQLDCGRLDARAQVAQPMLLPGEQPGRSRQNDQKST